MGKAVKWEACGDFVYDPGMVEALQDISSLDKSRRSRWIDYAPAWAAALLAVALYAVTLGGTYIYDDMWIARNDPRLHAPYGWLGYFREGYFRFGADNLWRPLVSLSFVAEWRLYGETAWPRHLLNILLHAAASAGVAELARRMFNRRAAWVAGLLFAAHPIHVEAVAALVGRNETLCTTGMIWAMALFATGVRSGRQVMGIYALFLMALFSKEQSLLLPPMLLAMGCLVRPGWPGRKVDEVERRTLMLLFVLVSFSMFAYVAYRDRILPMLWDKELLDWTINPMTHATGLSRVLLPVSLIGRYATLLVWPAKLSPDYGLAVIGPEFHFSDVYFWVGVATVIGYVALWWMAVARGQKTVMFCLIGLGLSYLMVGNFAIIGTIFAERLMYLPSAFLVILAGAATARWDRRALVAAMAVVLVLAGVRTASYAWMWNDRVRLYEATLRNQPRSAQLHILLAHTLVEYAETDTKNHRPEDARTKLLRAREVMAEGRKTAPECSRIFEVSAEVAMAMGDLDEAERYLKEGLELAQTSAAETLGARLASLRAMQAKKHPATTQAASTQPTR